MNSPLVLKKNWLYCPGGEFDVDHREIARPNYSFKPSRAYEQSFIARTKDE